MVQDQNRLCDGAGFDDGAPDPAQDSPGFHGGETSFSDSSFAGVPAIDGVVADRRGWRRVHVLVHGSGCLPLPALTDVTTVGTSPR